jgi:hypothetical protein
MHENLTSIGIFQKHGLRTMKAGNDLGRSCVDTLSAYV